MEKKALYIRISSGSQNTSRQEIKNFDGKVFKETCSGVIPFKERPSGSKLVKSIESGELNFVQVKSIDRLGRDAYDIQKSIKYFEDHNCQLLISEYGLTLFNGGKINPMFKLITDLLANIAQMERDNIRERQRQGVELAKAKGVYIGRKKGTAENSEKFLKKYTPIVNIIKNSNGKLTANAISKMVKDDTGKPIATPPTVRKVMELLG